MQFPEDCDFVCIGSWEPSLYEKALSWVEREPKRRVVFLSSEKIPSENPRIQIYEVQSIFQQEIIARKIAWSAVFSTPFFLGEENILYSIRNYLLAAELILSDAADFWQRCLQNGKAHQELEYRNGLDLKGAFASIPAVIVGAGPSLAQQQKAIADLSSRSLVFAAASALPFLETAPHFAGTIDPIGPSFSLPSSFFQTPLFFQPRANPAHSALFSGEKILFPDPSCPALNWLYDLPSFDGGWTVGTFLLGVAEYLGCSPIVLVGMDFCYEEGKKYPGLEGEKEATLVAFRGKQTQRDWCMAVHWIEERARQNRWFQLGGGGILELERKTIDECIRMFPLLPALGNSIPTILSRLNARNAKKRWMQWEASYERCQRSLEGKEKEGFYTHYLEPLWRIWEPIFQREIEIDPQQSLAIHQRLFFDTLIEQYT